MTTTCALASSISSHACVPVRSVPLSALYKDLAWTLPGPQNIDRFDPNFIDNNLYVLGGSSKFMIRSLGLNNGPLHFCSKLFRCCNLTKKRNLRACKT